MKKEMEEYKDYLFSMLNEFKDNIRNSFNPLLQKNFNDEWFKIVKDDIEVFCKTNQDRIQIPSYSTLVGSPFLIFHEQSEFDRLNQVINNIDNITKKKKVLRNKIKLISKKFTKKDEIHNFSSVIFELFAIGKIIIGHKDVKLLDIEFKHHDNSESNIDSIIEIANRKILVEITLIYRSLRKCPIEIREEIYEKTGKDIGITHSIGVLGIDEMIKQVQNKIIEKVEQIGYIEKPLILIIGLPSFGADLRTSRIVIKQEFDKKDTRYISSVIICPYFLFKRAYVFFNPNSSNPLNHNEKELIEHVFQNANL